MLPTFSFGMGIMDLYSNYQMKFQVTSLCQAYFPAPEYTIEECCIEADALIKTIGDAVPNFSCPPPDYGAWESPGIARYVFAMCVEGAAFFVLAVCIDTFKFADVAKSAGSRLSAACFGADPNAQDQGHDPEAVSAEDEGEDEDVAAERLRVQAEDTADDVVVVDHISKEYAGQWFGRSHTAVSRLTVGIKKGTCFGLLGVNGAGKTSTFKMLTGDESISSGTAYIDGLDIRKDLASARQRLG